MDLLTFYNGQGIHPETELTFEELIKQDDKFWEECHDFIQWMFPNPTPSQFNSNAPLLTQAESYQLDEKRIEMALMRFFKFIKLDSNEPPWWFKEGDHNLLRITRVLIFINLLGLYRTTEILLETLYYWNSKAIDPVPSETLNYWNAASAVTWETFNRRN